MLFEPATGVADDSTLRVEAAAQAMAMQIRVLNASTVQDVDAAFADLARDRPNGLLVGTGPFVNDRRVQLAKLAARHAIPAVYKDRQAPEVGGLASYGANLADGYRHVGAYAGRILKGAKPADLPVVQSTRFELVINHSTARTLGLNVPPSAARASRRGDRINHRSYLLQCMSPDVARSGPEPMDGCPQLVEADIRAFGRHSGFDPDTDRRSSGLLLHTFFRSPPFHASRFLAVMVQVQGKVGVILGSGEGNETARVHHVARWHCGSFSPLAARAQHAFAQRLRQLSWIEGRTVTIEYRWAEGDSARYVEIATEVVQLKPSVIVTNGNAAVAAVKQVTSSISIVFAVRAIRLARA